MNERRRKEERVKVIVVLRYENESRSSLASGRVLLGEGREGKGNEYTRARKEGKEKHQLGRGKKMVDGQQRKRGSKEGVVSRQGRERKELVGSEGSEGR